ncbi:MAG: gamma-glutamyltransferase family protein [Planctomycetota bacterium]
MPRDPARPQVSRSAVYARGGAVATSQPLATLAAQDVLRRGGSATDAAICANAVLGVVEPTGCGVGGDLMAIVQPADGSEPVGFNGSGRSPRGLEREEVARRGLARVPMRGALSVSVPGCVDGWFALHERFGRLPMTELLAPAIAYAKDGFPLSPVIAREWAAGVRALHEYPNFVAQFTVDGRAPKVGEVFSRPALARVLERVASDGRSGFYAGEVARTIEREVRGAGGFLSAADLAEHRGAWVTPLSVRYRDVELLELPANTQGPTALEMVGILARFDVRAMGYGSAEFLHHLVEAKKLAFADRACTLGDPDLDELADGARLLVDDRLDELAARIDRERACDVATGSPTVRHGDTVCLAVADARGEMVSLIQSNFRGFGSGVAPKGLGFVLQNRGELFDLDPSRPNGFAPGKRPFHTIIPGFARRRGEPWLAFGVMGGDTQPQAHAQVLANLVDFDLDVQEAGDAPRCVHTGGPEPTGGAVGAGVGDTALEPGFEPAEVRELERRGHRISFGGGHFGGYQAVLRLSANGVHSAGSDARKDGCAAGL